MEGVAEAADAGGLGAAAVCGCLLHACLCVYLCGHVPLTTSQPTHHPLPPKPPTAHPPSNPPVHRSRLQELFPKPKGHSFTNDSHMTLSENGFDLLSGMLHLDPAQRLSAKVTLELELTLAFALAYAPQPSTSPLTSPLSPRHSQDALAHPYFTEVPLPCSQDQLPVFKPGGP